LQANNFLIIILYIVLVGFTILLLFCLELFIAISCLPWHCQKDSWLWLYFYDYTRSSK